VRRETSGAGTLGPGIRCVVFSELAFAALYRLGPIPPVFVEPPVAVNDELATGPAAQVLLGRVEAVLAPIPIAEVAGGDYPAHRSDRVIRWGRERSLRREWYQGSRKIRDREG
jgi:hypothetical protein